MEVVEVDSAVIKFPVLPTDKMDRIRVGLAGNLRDYRFLGRSGMKTRGGEHDNGGYTSWGATTPFVMMQAFSSLYRVPHVNMRGRVVYTNNPYSGSMRGYGNLQATFSVESSIDLLAEIASEERTIVFYESPHRIQKTVRELNESWGDRRCVMGREIKKKFEEFYRK